MKFVRFLGAAGLALAAAPTLNAAPIDGTTSTICLVSGGLNSCASVTASVAGSVLTATVKNLGGDNDYTLTAFGFSFSGTSTASALTLSPSPQTNSGKTWESGDFGLFNPGPDNAIELGAAGRCQGAGCNVAQGLHLNESITLTFNITGTLTGSESNLLFAFRGQEWEGAVDGSFKCYEGAGNSTPEGSTCEGGPGSTVPEPASMALLATGLVGMGGATMLRRRRKNKD